MDLLRLEQQRCALEESLQKLRASLKHWQTLEAELEGFKEELNAPGDPDLDKISVTFAADLLTEKEIRELAALDSHVPRTGPQILGIISRRQEYVQKNIETVQRQFWDSEAKLEELDFMAYSSANRDAHGGTLPLTEILEELDDDGNVISATLSQPEAHTAKLVDALRKVGVSELDLRGTTEDVAAAGDADESPPTLHAPRPALVERPFRTADHAWTTSTAHHSPERPPIRKKSVSFTADTKPPPEPSRQDSEDGKKSVSFNDKVAVMPAAPLPDARSVSFSPQIEEIPADPIVASPEVQAQSNIDSLDPLRGMMFKPGEKVTEINDEEEPVSTHVVRPEGGDTAEDARIRREMLNFHLHEVGHVVAQLELEEDEEMDGEESASTSDFTSDYLDEDTSYASGLSDTEDDSEDEFGRTKRRVVSDDYHKQMQDLEHRLIDNLGRAPKAEDVSALDPALDPSDVRRLVIREQRNLTSSGSSDGEKKSTSKKRVSFAEALDVADEVAVPPMKATKHEQGENAAPVSDNVPERMALAAVSTPQVPALTKASRFKKDRATPLSDESNSAFGHDEHGAPTGPVGKIIADKLLERPSVMRRQVAAPSTDDPDAIMQRRELAAEYYRRRNDIIRQQGGFKASSDDDDMGEWMEEKDGKLKKVSRFKAARIKPQ